MALNPSTPAHAAASHSAASALSGVRTNARSRLAAGDDDGGGFAAELMRAQPAPHDDAKPSDATSSDAADKPAAKDAEDAKTPAATPPATDPNAVPPWAQALAPAPATTTLAAQGGMPGGTELAGGPLAALRKGAAARGGKDDALPGAGKDAALAGKASQAADPTAALAAAAGADNAATGTRDSMAALLPQADPVAVQAGAIGASPNALLDTKSAVEQAAASAPAQAALPMSPQSPAFAPALGQQIEVWMRDGIGHAEVQLTPQDLGPIRVRIAVDGAQTRVEMSADVASTRDALQQALPQLSDSLSQVGLSLTGGGVSDQSTAQSQAQAQAGADGGFGGSGGRPGGGARTRGDAGDGGADPAVASAARQAAQRRGLLDMYA